MERVSLLVVDDNLGIRRLLEEVFSAEGYDVITAASGLEAIALVQKQLPNLVIADIKMPGINGLELRDQLLNLNPNIRFILMSAYTDHNEIKEIIHQNEIDYALTKPFDLKLMIKVVADIINKKRPNASIENK